VVDDGEAFPADAAAVDAVGGRIIRVEPGTLLGTKLNRGLAEARGALCQKMDDDDWYAPEFLEAMVSAVLSSWSIICRPTVAFLTPFLFFEVRLAGAAIGRASRTGSHAAVRSRRVAAPSLSCPAG